MKRLSFGSTFFITLFICPQLKGQDLDKLRWEKRLILLLVDNEKQPELALQLKLLEADTDGMAERKLEVICIAPEKMRIGIDSSRWNNNTSLYKKHHRKGSFEFILIGLDGGEKLRRQEVMPLKELYRIIDSMPMRAAEMRRKNN